MPLKTIKRIFSAVARKVFKVEIRRVASPQNLANPLARFDTFINAGNVIIGNNSDVSDLNILIQESEKGFANVTIGNDCEIHGQILVYNKNAKVVIGDRVYIGQNTMLFCYEDIQVLDDTLISWGCTLIDTNSHSLKSSERITDVMDWKKGGMHKNWSVVEAKPIVVGKQVWIGFNSIIMKGVIINNGSIVAAGSVVTKNVDPYSIVGGNPAQFIKSTT